MRFQAFAVLSLAFSMMACGRQDTVYIDPAAAGAVTIDEHTLLPDQFADQSVNNAVVGVTADAGTYSVRLRLLGGSATPGNFNLAAATGNRAILGIGRFDRSLLSSFDFKVSSVSSTSSQLTVSLIVDVTCDQSQPLRTLESEPLSTGNDVSIAKSAAVWSVDGSSTRSSLNDLIATYPAACLRNGVSHADDLPKGLSLGSVLFSIGTLNSTDTQALTISNVEINGETYTSLSASWGKQ